jgi:hypothetical protein
MGNIEEIEEGQKQVKIKQQQKNIGIFGNEKD